MRCKDLKLGVIWVASVVVNPFQKVVHFAFRMEGLVVLVCWPLQYSIFEKNVMKDWKIYNIKTKKPKWKANKTSTKTFIYHILFFLIYCITNEFIMSLIQVIRINQKVSNAYSKSRCMQTNLERVNT